MFSLFFYTCFSFHVIPKYRRFSPRTQTCLKCCVQWRVCWCSKDDGEAHERYNSEGGKIFFSSAFLSRTRREKRKREKNAFVPSGAGNGQREKSTPRLDWRISHARAAGWGGRESSFAGAVYATRSCAIFLSAWEKRRVVITKCDSGAGGGGDF